MNTVINIFPICSQILLTVLQCIVQILRYSIHNGYRSGIVAVPYYLLSHRNESKVMLNVTREGETQSTNGYPLLVSAGSNESQS